MVRVQANSGGVPQWRGSPWDGCFIPRGGQRAVACVGPASAGRCTRPSPSPGCSFSTPSHRPSAHDGLHPRWRRGPAEWAYHISSVSIDELLQGGLYLQHRHVGQLVLTGQQRVPQLRVWVRQDRRTRWSTARVGRLSRSPVASHQTMRQQKPAPRKRMHLCSAEASRDVAAGRQDVPVPATMT